MVITKMTDLDLNNKRVLIRSDLNVPIKNGKINSDIRIRASLPTIKIALKKNARVIIASHLGRPVEGKYDNNFSLQPIVNYLKNEFDIPVKLLKNYLNGINFFKDELIILENVRFNKGEKENNKNLAKKYAALCDIFVMDAFGVSHRSQASTCGVSEFSPISCIGPLLFNEIKILNKALKNPNRPMVAIVGGSKISTKLTALNSLAKIADYVIIGGGIANTFIAAKGYNIGRSIYESNLIVSAKNLMKNTNIIVPTDVYVTNNFSEISTPNLKSINNIQDNEQIVDIGDNSISYGIELIKKAKTILWNGPIGKFEFINFSKGTEAIARSIAESKAFSIAGGGDTLAAIDLFGIYDHISYISTGGGSFLKLIEGKEIPIISILEKKNNIKI